MTREKVDIGGRRSRRATVPSSAGACMSDDVVGEQESNALFEDIFIGGCFAKIKEYMCMGSAELRTITDCGVFNWWLSLERLQSCG